MLSKEDARDLRRQSHYTVIRDAEHVLQFFGGFCHAPGQDDLCALRMQFLREPDYPVRQLVRHKILRGNLQFLRKMEGVPLIGKELHLPSSTLKNGGELS